MCVVCVVFFNSLCPITTFNFMPPFPLKFNDRSLFLLLLFLFLFSTRCCCRCRCRCPGVCVCVFYSNWYCCTIIITLCLSCFWLLCAQLKQLIDAIYMYLQLVSIIHWWAKLLFCVFHLNFDSNFHEYTLIFIYILHTYIEIYMHRIFFPRISYTISHPYLIYYTGIECNCYIANMN